MAHAEDRPWIILLLDIKYSIIYTSIQYNILCRYVYADFLDKLKFKKKIQFI